MDIPLTVFCAKLFSQNLTKTLFLSVFVFILHVSIFFGFFQGLVLLLSYVIGLYLFHLLLKRVTNVREVFSSIADAILQKYYSYNNDAASSMGTSDVQNSSVILVHSDIDNALEQLLNRILNQYITNWYSNISTDVSFQCEIREIIKHVVFVCYARISKVKLEHFLFEKGLPIILNHINTYDDIKYNNEIAHLHIAVHSRKAENLYLQNVSKCLLKHILPNVGLRCKSYNVLLREILSRSLIMSLSDAACNPSLLNFLLWYYFNNNFQFPTSKNENIFEKVELLHNFVSTFQVKLPYSSVRPDMATIMKDQDLLNAFMSYLKSSRTDNVLQFSIDIENFNQRILKPDLDPEELDYLYRDAWDLYSVYFSSHSPSCIKFPKDFASSLRKVLSKDVLKLRTMNTLYEAHEYAYTLLDSYCYDFHNSKEFYAWLYGQNETSNILKSKNSPARANSPIPGSAGRKPVFEFSNKLNKIKDVLKSNSVQEGQMLIDQNKTADCETSMEMGEDVQMTVGSDRNLNYWKISIPTVGSRLDPVTNKAYTVFVLQIQTEDNKEWLVERRPIDFYSLDVKLTEFHGTSIDAQLPPRRLLTTRLESILLYEEYLQKLINNHVLKNSELLYTFLTSTEEFAGEDTSLSKLFRKSVVPNLRKERGQNLDMFLSSFLNSCRATKYEWKDVGEKLSAKIKREPGSTNMYENNFNINPDISMQIFFNPSERIENDFTITKPSTIVFYLAMKVYKIEMKIAKILLSLQSIFGGIFDQILIHLTRRGLNSVITSCNIAYLISIIEWAIFDAKPKSSPEDVNKALIESLNQKKNSWFYPLYFLVYETIQDPKMNKQLFYKLMDAVLVELFPELDNVDRV